MQSLRRVALRGAAAAAACVAWGVVVERRWFVRRDVHLPGALRGGPPMTVVHVADTHLGRRDERMRRLLADVVADARPDLVVAAGDLCGGVDVEDDVVEVLRPLTAAGTPGLVVLGSNDLYGPRPKSPFTYFTAPDRRTTGPRLRTDRLVAGLEATGWRVLEDERTRLEVGGRAVAVAALHDPHLAEPPPPSRDEVDLRDADDVDLRLGLVHAPYRSALDLLVDAGCDVLLAGHTHGGQVRLPGVGALTANCDLPLDRARGASRWRGAWLHVTPGLGQSTYAPFRFACRPEVSVLHLAT